MAYADGPLARAGNNSGLITEFVQRSGTRFVVQSADGAADSCQTFYFAGANSQFLVCSSVCNSADNSATATALLACVLTLPWGLCRWCLQLTLPSGNMSWKYWTLLRILGSVCCVSGPLPMVQQCSTRCSGTLVSAPSKTCPWHADVAQLMWPRSTHGLSWGSARICLLVLALSSQQLSSSVHLQVSMMRGP